MKNTNKEQYIKKSLGNITFFSKQIKTLRFPIFATFLRVKKNPPNAFENCKIISKKPNFSEF